MCSLQRNIGTRTPAVHHSVSLLSHFFGSISSCCDNKSYAKIFIEQFIVLPLCINERLKTKTDLYFLIYFPYSRTLNGLGILVCSMDGSVAFLDFSQDELGDPLSEEEKVQ